MKNCGYPFQLQISTKEFLNELVKRFPERPPLFLTPYQSKILELIHEWKQTICVTSKHKEDYVHIRDMHRLLSYKGKLMLACCKVVGRMDVAKTDSAGAALSRLPLPEYRLANHICAEPRECECARAAPEDLG